nr:hypothetical protein [Tanacetum cinerariifolium]
MHTTDSVDTPMVEKSKPDEDLQRKLVDATLYRSMIGSLMYLTSSRLDLIYAVYLFDADQARCQDTRRSTSGSAQFLGEKLVSWSSMKQKSIAISDLKVTPTKNGQLTKPYSCPPYFIANCFNAGHLKMEVKSDSPEAASQYPIQTPPVPQDEDEHKPMFIQPHDPYYVPEPMYPEYIPLEDVHVLSAEEPPLPLVVSPTAESPEYVAESDPEEDLEEYKDDES